MKFSVSVAFLALSIYSVPSPQDLGFAYKFNSPDFTIFPQSIPVANIQTGNTQAASNENSIPLEPQQPSGSSLNFIGFDTSPSFSALEGVNNNQQGIQSIGSEPEIVDIEQFRVRN
jgi:hypothetical protein